LRVHGWSNALFSPDGASASHEGNPVAPGASVQAHQARGRVAFTLPAASLGRPRTLSGARVYVTTWDYDGGYRELRPLAGPYALGGGTPDGPRIMDASAVIVLP
jgi:hypothetical protein